jgi:hypothetical protein
MEHRQQLYDIENIPDDVRNKQQSHKIQAMMKAMQAASSSSCNSSSSGSSRPKFGSLLQVVQREQREMEDLTHAMQVQTNEAFELAVAWMREEQDKQLADQLVREAKEEEEKDKQRRAQEVAKNEAQALQVALEEQRRIKAEAKMKQDIESKDIEYAKRTVLDDVEEEYEMKEQLKSLCSNDEEYAKRVYEQLQDELLAEQLLRKEEEEILRKRQELEKLAEADEKLARLQQEHMDKEYQAEEKKRVEDDFAVACRKQTEFETETKQKMWRQELADYQYCKNLTINQMREQHRTKKRSQVLNSIADKFKSPEDIAIQWETADAEVEDVLNGVCMTILLPHLKDIKVRIAGKNKIEIDASRTLFIGEKNATAENSTYCADFVIEGECVNVKDESVTYEYCSQTGLLHIYIDRIQLNKEDEKGSKDDKGSDKRTLLKKMTNHLSRIFNRSKKNDK